MKIEVTSVVKLKLTQLDRLDPIGVVLEDIEPSKGKITIDCYGKAWSAYWGGMGDRSIAQFFVSCDNGYLAGNLSSISNTVDDFDALTDLLRTEICRKRRSHELDSLDAREMFDDAAHVGDGPNETNHKLLRNLLGDEYWYSIPTKQNPDYAYLCRIIDAVRTGLKEYLNMKVAA